MARKPGRPAGFTPEQVAALCEALRTGNHIEPSCRYVGIAPSTYYKYMALAEEPDPPAWVREFSEAVKKARAEAELRNVQAIAKAATDPRHWTAAAWFLERSYPKRWGRQARLELSGPEGGPIQVEDPRDALIRLLDSAAEQQAEAADLTDL